MFILVRSTITSTEVVEIEPKDLRKSQITKNS